LHRSVLGDIGDLSDKVTLVRHFNHPRHLGHIASDRSGLLRQRWRGFSLIEVLVATAILATGLIAASRAALVATNDQGILRDRTLARWVAHNTLAEIRLRPQQAQPGSNFTQQAQQSGMSFTATTKVTATPSPIFSRVEVTVSRASGDSQILATAVGFSARP
jgi:general secretion pathway protein I